MDSRLVLALVKLLDNINKLGTVDSRLVLALVKLLDDINKLAEVAVKMAEEKQQRKKDLDADRRERGRR